VELRLLAASVPMVGTILGALIIRVINNGRNMLSVTYFYQLIVKGLVICRLVRHS
jgi:ribose/xylose/arabinose/galactoside ABC-type transport system permease subunit